MASSIFPTANTVTPIQTATGGALSGDGSSGNKLAVTVDGASIGVNGSDQLEAIGMSGATDGELLYNDGGSFGGITGSSVSGADVTLGGDLTLGDGSVFKLGPNAATVADADIGPGTSSSTDDGAVLTVHGGDSSDPLESAAAGALILRGGNNPLYQGGDLILKGGVGVDGSHAGGVFLGVNNVSQWQIGEGSDLGTFMPTISNTWDLGSVDNVVRRGYFGDIVLGGTSQTIQGAEVTAPTAPAANGFKIYAVDNGGKTELLALFNSGAAQRIAIQP